MSPRWGSLASDVLLASDISPLRGLLLFDRLTNYDSTGLPTVGRGVRRLAQPHSHSVSVSHFKVIE
jgi:hypothetical protein